MDWSAHLMNRGRVHNAVAGLAEKLFRLDHIAIGSKELDTILKHSAKLSTKVRHQNRAPKPGSIAAMTEAIACAYKLLERYEGKTNHRIKNARRALALAEQELRIMQAAETLKNEPTIE
jgi:hypothetical protein